MHVIKSANCGHPAVLPSQPATLDQAGDMKANKKWTSKRTVTSVNSVMDIRESLRSISANGIWLSPSIQNLNKSCVLDS